MKSLTPYAVQQRLQSGETLALLDVRTPGEHAELHVPGVHLVPLDSLDPEKLVSVDGFAKDKPAILFCRTGGRAKLAAERLAKGGFAQCYIVEGGMLAWVEAGLPVDRGAHSVISLERQVRIAAGSIVLSGVILAQFVHPLSIWISGFVGAGLIFAGVTDWCGMGMLLARMPWNRRNSSATFDNR